MSRSLFLRAALAAALAVTGAAAQGQVALDPSFGTGGRRAVGFDLDSLATDSARRVFEAEAGRLLLVGQASRNGGVALAIARLLPNGAIDPSFDGDGRLSLDLDITSVLDVAQDAQGRLLVLGTAPVSGGSSVLVARILPSGQADASFGFLGLSGIDLNTEDEALALAVGPDSQPLVLLRSRPGSGFGWTLSAARLDANGQNLRSSLLGVAVDDTSAALSWSQQRGAFLGSATLAGSQTCNIAVWSLSIAADGTPQSTSLGGSTVADTNTACTQVRVNAVASAPGSGAPLVVAHREDPGAVGSGRQVGLLLKLLPGGGLDTAFAGGGRRLEPAPFPSSDLRFAGAAFDANGRLLVAGSVGNGANSAFSLWRYLPNGSPDTGFNGGSANIGTSFIGAGGTDSPISVARDLRLSGAHILLAGHYRYNGASDDDFALAAFTVPSATLFANGFED